VEAIKHLLSNSGLPGTRANLELLYSFSKSATEPEIKECLYSGKFEEEQVNING